MKKSFSVVFSRQSVTGFIQDANAEGQSPLFFPFRGKTFPDIVRGQKLVHVFDKDSLSLSPLRRNRSCLCSRELTYLLLLLLVFNTSRMTQLNVSSSNLKWTKTLRMCLNQKYFKLQLLNARSHSSQFAWRQYFFVSRWTFRYCTWLSK